MAERELTREEVEAEIARARAADEASVGPIRGTTEISTQTCHKDPTGRQFACPQYTVLYVLLG